MKKILWIILGFSILASAYAGISLADMEVNSVSEENTILEPAMIRVPGKNYEIGKYEVTQKQWRDIMNNNPSMFQRCGDNCPVESVNWYEVKTFIDKLNQKTGKTYRLPSEDEWVFACFGGKQTKYCGSNNINEVGWYAKNSRGHTHPVGKKQPNGYGIYDMSGNVFEWLEDSYGTYLNARKWRGGSSNYEIEDMDLSINYNWGWGAEARDSGCGFRLARSLPINN